jgi:hypothetical protein
LSVEAFQDRLICEVETATAVKLVGTDGATVSFTATVACAVALPALLEALNVYVVVLLGDTTNEVPVTAPTPLSIKRLGAGFPETVHESVEVPPLLTVEGEALNTEIVGATAWAGVVALAGADCPDTFPAASKAATP